MKQRRTIPKGLSVVTAFLFLSLEAFELNLARAEGTARFKNGAESRVFVNAAGVKEPVALVRIPGPPLNDLRLKTPDSVKKRGYPSPRTGKAAGLRWFE